MQPISSFGSETGSGQMTHQNRAPSYFEYIGDYTTQFMWGLYNKPVIRIPIKQECVRISSRFRQLSVQSFNFFLVQNRLFMYKIDVVWIYPPRAPGCNRGKVEDLVVGFPEVMNYNDLDVSRNIENIYEYTSIYIYVMFIYNIL